MTSHFKLVLPLGMRGAILLCPILLTPHLLHGVESFLEANCLSASQEISRILWNPKVHYRIHKCPPPVPILSHLNPFHTPTSHFLKIHSSSRIYALMLCTGTTLHLCLPPLQVLHISSLFSTSLIDFCSDTRWKSHYPFTCKVTIFWYLMIEYFGR